MSRWSSAPKPYVPIKVAETGHPVRFRSSVFVHLSRPGVFSGVRPSLCGFGKYDATRVVDDEPTCPRCLYLRASFGQET